MSYTGVVVLVLSHLVLISLLIAGHRTHRDTNRIAYHFTTLLELACLPYSNLFFVLVYDNYLVARMAKFLTLSRYWGLAQPLFISPPVPEVWVAEPVHPTATPLRARN